VRVVEEKFFNIAESILSSSAPFGFFETTSSTDGKAVSTMKVSSSFSGSLTFALITVTIL